MYGANHSAQTLCPCLQTDRANCSWIRTPEFVLDPSIATHIIVVSAGGVTHTRSSDAYARNRLAIPIKRVPY